MARKAKVCSLCQKEYKGATCPSCTETGVDVKKVLESEKAQMEKNEAASVPTAFLVDLVSNRKIPITTPRCRVGRDDLNDIVISGDQSISRFHFIITYENGQYQTQDAKSRHGTFLNGNQIGGPEPINDGDVLKIGVSLFWFVIESQAGAEKDEPLPPVDVEKAQSGEELSLKKGGDAAYAGELPLSATQEISIISPEQLAQYSLTKQAEDNEFEAKEKVEPIVAETEKASSKADDDSKSEKEESERTDDDAKSAESKEPESESPKSDSKEDESQDDDDKKEAESKEDEAKTSEADEPPASKDSESDSDNDSKSESKEEEKSAEPTSSSESDGESKDSKSDEIELAVKELLEPLQDEIAASREMIRDALKKGEMSFDTDSPKAEEEKSEPEKSSSEEEKPESPKEDEPKEPESKESSTDEEDKEKDKDNDETSSKSDGDSADEKSEPESSSDKDEEQPESSAKNDKAEDVKAEEAETLERIAEIIDDSTAKSDLADKSDEQSPGVSANSIETKLASDHDKATNGFSEDIETIMGPTTVPDWCKRYFSDELKHLNKELDSLNDQIKQYQEKIRKIENQAAQTKGLRNTLLTADGDDLIEACKQVLGLAGWKVTQSDEDKHEFLLEHEDEKVAIARVISIKGAAERSHLGQLSIAQTRFWCEKGIEPKGVLIVGRVSDKSPKERGDDTNAEVNEYANMKNVCLMNTLQLLALYRDIALKDGKSSEMRNSIHDSKGWLKGFDIEPGDESGDDDDKEGSKSKSLSSLLSA